MNSRSRRLRRQRRKDARDPHRHQEKTIRFREQMVRSIRSKREHRRSMREYHKSQQVPPEERARRLEQRVLVVDPKPLTGGALLTTMLQGKPIQ